MQRTKGQLEAEISEAITRFEKEYIGRGPQESKTFIIDDMILIRLKCVLTPAEIKLAAENGGSQLIKQMRMRLLESSQSLITTMIEDIIKSKVNSLLTDLNPKTGERIFVFTLNDNIQKRFSSENKQ
ncbi:MAG: DUF2294 domain-containing protein [Calditrichaceae bacterium]|nr:DUF2294 domain-containing protein [Calditrichaceae bacterium]MBN2708603.1 DUF2294 domain-containing protein [Calditrichaceae bacterium]RQV95454.1 MAG: DUF2294 domain-containing protein [Calditrichota bacterium]